MKLHHESVVSDHQVEDRSGYDYRHKSFFDVSVAKLAYYSACIIWETQWAAQKPPDDTSLGWQARLPGPS
jgi:hypothetical protein